MADRIPLVISGSSIREIPSADRLDVQGALEVNGHITPGTDSAYDIGTSSLKFRDIYLSSGTVHLGGVKLRADGNKLSIQDSTGADAGITAGTLGELSSDDLTEGATNLFTTAARTRSHINVVDAGGDGSFTYDSALGKLTYTGPSASEVRAHINVVDAGGDGSFAYDSALGKLTYTGPSASEVRAHFSGSSGVSYNSGTGAITIGQAVGTTDSVTFGGLYASGNAIIGGNLTVNGTTTTVNSTNSLVADPLIELNTGATSNANDLGFIMERGSTGNNAAIIWDESEDKFKVGTTTNTGADTGNLTVTTGTLIANIEGNVTGNVTGSSGSTTGNAATATALETARNIGGVSFNGTGDINLPGVNTAGNQNTSGNAATATALATARAFSLTGDVTASGVNFDGTGAVALSTTIAAGAVSSNELASASTLLLKNTAGSTLKTIIGAGS